MGLKGYRLWATCQLDSTCRAPPRGRVGEAVFLLLRGGIPGEVRFERGRFLLALFPRDQPHVHRGVAVKSWIRKQRLETKKSHFRFQGLETGRFQAVWVNWIQLVQTLVQTLMQTYADPCVDTGADTCAYTCADSYAYLCRDLCRYLYNPTLVCAATTFGLRFPLLGNARPYESSFVLSWHT
jgi:hypothetical protein